MVVATDVLVDHHRCQRVDLESAIQWDGGGILRAMQGHHIDPVFKVLSAHRGAQLERSEPLVQRGGVRHLHTVGEHPHHHIAAARGLPWFHLRESELGLYGDRGVCSQVGPARGDLVAQIVEHRP